MSVRIAHPAFCPAILCSVLAATLVACAKGSEKYPGSYESAAGNVGARPSTTTATKPTASVPPSVDAVGTHGEDLYDQVKAGSWKKASEHLDSLRAAIAQLPADVNTKASLTALTDSLSRDIAGKRREQGMIDANRVTYLAAEMTRPYASTVPVQVMLLDYDGRELEIWSAARDNEKLAATKRDLRRTWDEIRPEIQKRNPKQAEHTETLVARIEAAKTPAELSKLATPFLDEVDLLENVFKAH